MARLASPRRRWWGRPDSGAAEHEDRAPNDATTTTTADRDVRDDRDARYEHSAKVDKATEQAADAIRDAAARAAADRAHARARTSALASIGLVLAVVAALVVATGVLAVIGVAIGVIALLFAIGGLTTTGRRHFVAGRGEAIFGILLAAVAIVVGVLAISGVIPEVGTDTNQVEQLRDMLPSWLR